MRKLIITLACISLIAVAVIGAVLFIKTAPKAERKRPPKIAPLVETQHLKASNQTVVLKLTGTVVPAEDIVLRARVGGEIVAIAPDFIDGGRLDEGTQAVRIDPVDYKLALADAESRLEKARFDYKLELGRQDVAKREWELLKSDDASEMEKELALRIPHLAASKAALEAAESSLEKARLNLERTRVHVPFDAIVLERRVNIGSQASPQDALARLAGTESYWVQVSIPVDRLGWVNIPGSTARVISNSGAVREGTVIMLLGDLEEKGRMARLLVEVGDPLCRLPENAGKKPLLIGEYVRVEISGRRLEQVYTIPRYALRENSSLWLTKDEKLDIRKVDILWRDADQVIVRDGLADGERLIISDLTTPVQGMDVSIRKGKAEPQNTPQ
jgi:RND family efflux transporter MFP subunit